MSATQIPHDCIDPKFASAPADRGTVLVVDDDRLNRAILTRLLRQQGFLAIEAADGYEALECVKGRSIDLVLLDIVMPGMSGFDVLTELRRSNSEAELPIIMVTADDNSDHIVRALSEGANDFLSKPIDAGVTIARISTQMRLMKSQQALKESEERYSLAAEGANDGLWDWNLLTNEVYYSPRWNRLLGISGIGTAPEEWFSRIHPDDKACVESELQAHLGGVTPHFEAELRIKHNNGNYRWMLCRGMAVRAEGGDAHRIAGSMRDITDGKFADAVTGLPNRILLCERVQARLNDYTADPSQSFAVLYLDLDNFKLINDTLGHAAGDRLLTAVARRLERATRSSQSLVARLGGDEFAILVTNIASPADLNHIAERLLQNFASPFSPGGGAKEVFVTVSIGMSLASDRSQRAEDMLREADTAMYKAKAQGKSCYRTFDPEMQEDVSCRLRLESQLRRALDRKEFVLNYQPLVSLPGAEVIGFEALIRWQHPKLGLISPAEFIPIAEETGLIVPIGQWVLETASAQLVAWKLAFPHKQNLQMAINVSRRQMRHTDLLSDVTTILGSPGIRPGDLKLEITEGTIMEDPEQGAKLLGELRDRGVKIAIDDFGTGYSSLACLHSLPLDTLKIDQSFVARMTGSGDSLAIVRTIIRLAESFGFDVVAEGIGTEDQHNMLSSLHCDFGQGFLYSPPLSSEAAGELLADNHSWEYQQATFGGGGI